MPNFDWLCLVFTTKPRLVSNHNGGFIVYMENMNDEFYMKLALDMAQKTKGQTGINPSVGCVIVKAGRIVGIGAHLKRGQGHAEVNACHMAGEETIGATAYVTLEPCSHYGKTPPCCELLIDKGIKRVVIAALDPNPQVAGKGVKRLKEAGVEVITHIMSEQSHAINESFNKYILTRLPFVTMKTATTLDGKVATKTGSSQWISSAEARAEVHTMRHQHMGIMVGSGTILHDNPSLSTRLEVDALQPRPIIIDSRLSIPLDAKVLQINAGQTIVITTEQASSTKAEQLKALGVTVLSCGQSEGVDLELAMRKLGELEISSILLEGGGTLNGAMLQQGLIDKIVIYYGMKIVGGKLSPSLFDFDGVALMSEAITLEQPAVQTVGPDVKLTGYPSNRQFKFSPV